MTAADVGRLALIVLLGFLAFLIFLLAATILALMWLDSSRCNCYHLPAGIYVLGVLFFLIIGTMVSEGIEHIQGVVEGWVNNSTEALILIGIFLLVILLVLF
jgi:hypothetical protein